MSAVHRLFTLSSRGLQVGLQGRQYSRSRKLGKLQARAQARARLLIVAMFMELKLMGVQAEVALLVVAIAMPLSLLAIQAALLLLIALPLVPARQMRQPQQLPVLVTQVAIRFMPEEVQLGASIHRRVLIKLRVAMGVMILLPPLI